MQIEKCNVSYEKKVKLCEIFKVHSEKSMLKIPCGPKKKKKEKKNKV